MPIQSTPKPELAVPTKSLIKNLWGIHNKPGGGQISLKFLFDLFSGLGQIPDELKTKLNQREDIKIVPTEKNAGRFENSGKEKIKTVVDKLHLKVPMVFGGDYLSFENDCCFTFDSDTQIQLSSYFIRVNVERLIGSQNMLKIDLTGDSYDQCFTF